MVLSADDGLVDVVEGEQVLGGSSSLSHGIVLSWLIGLRIILGRHLYLFCVGLFPSLFMALLYQKEYPILGTPLKVFSSFSKSFLCDVEQMMGRCSAMFISEKR